MRCGVPRIPTAAGDTFPVSSPGSSRPLMPRWRFMESRQPTVHGRCSNRGNRPTGAGGLPSKFTLPVGAPRCASPYRSAGANSAIHSKGVRWLLDSWGVESSFVNRAAARLGFLKAERRLDLKAWPWKPNTSSWVEPTSEALVALKKASPKFASDDLRERIQLGEAQLMDVRCRDGGWNYGSPAALGVALPSYPETTALALIGLQGREDLAPSLEIAASMARGTASPLARAWLAIALSLHGAEAPQRENAAPSSDLMITAIEALGAPDGNYRMLKTAGA